MTQGVKRPRGRPRRAIYTESLNVGFSPDQMDKMNRLSEKHNIGLNTIVRECVDSDLQRLDQRLSKRTKRGSSTTGISPT